MSSKLLRLAISISLVLFCSGVSNADIVLLNNGLDCLDEANVLSGAGNADNSVWVRNVGCPANESVPDSECSEPWGEPTLVCVQEGALVDDLFASETSIVEVTGGSVERLTTLDQALVRISGGEIHRTFDAVQDSRIEVSGGVLASVSLSAQSTLELTRGEVRSINTYTTANATISGGSVPNGLDALGFSTATITGGQVGGVSVTCRASVTLSGGQITQSLAVHDERGFFGGFCSNPPVGAPSLTIHGSSFQVDGQPVEFGAISATAGRLTGVLSSGDWLQSEFQRSGSHGLGVIVLVEAPADTVKLDDCMQVSIDDATYWSDIIEVSCSTSVELSQHAIAIAIYAGGTSSVNLYDSYLYGTLVARDEAEVRVHSGSWVEVLAAYGESTAELDGGTVLEGFEVGLQSTGIIRDGVVLGGVEVADDAQLTMLGGTVVGLITAFDSATVVIDDGLIEGGVYHTGSGTIIMNGGQAEYLSWGRSNVFLLFPVPLVLEEPVGYMTGGSARRVSVGSAATLTFSGGFTESLSTYLSGVATLSGGYVTDHLIAYDSSLIVVQGYGFAVDGEPVGSGDLSAHFGALTGTLSDGSPLDVYFHQQYSEDEELTDPLSLSDPTGTIRLELVPEARETLLAGMSLVTLAMLRRQSVKRRTLPRPSAVSLRSLLAGVLGAEGEV